MHLLLLNKGKHDTSPLPLEVNTTHHPSPITLKCARHYKYRLIWRNWAQNSITEVPSWYYFHQKRARKNSNWYPVDFPPILHQEIGVIPSTTPPMKMRYTFEHSTPVITVSSANVEPTRARSTYRATWSFDGPIAPRELSICLARTMSMSSVALGPHKKPQNTLLSKTPVWMEPRFTFPANFPSGRAQERIYERLRMLCSQDRPSEMSPSSSPSPSSDIIEVLNVGSPSPDATPRESSPLFSSIGDRPVSESPAKSRRITLERTGGLGVYWCRKCNHLIRHCRCMHWP